MRACEAKDFLVQQTAEQAALENVSLSDLEKRMMYFTEGPGALEDPTALNDEFEAQYDNAAYEKKISKLMSHAHKRLKKEDPEKAKQWNMALRSLQKGDHYILVLAGDAAGASSVRGWRVTLSVLLPLGVLVLGGFLLLRFVRPPGPYGVRILQALFVALVIAAIFFPRVFEPAGNAFGRCLDWIAGINNEKEEIEKSQETKR